MAVYRYVPVIISVSRAVVRLKQLENLFCTESEKNRILGLWWLIKLCRKVLVTSCVLFRQSWLKIRYPSDAA